MNKILTEFCKPKLLVFLLLAALYNIASAQLSFINSGQQLNKLAGRGVVLDDFNGDHNIDAFVVNEDGPEGKGYRVYFGDGSGQFTVSSQNLTNPISWSGIPVIGDIDGDSIKEVITGWTVWENDGKGIFTADTNRFDNRRGGDIMQMGLSDLNNDSSPDIFAVVYDGSGTSTRVYLNNGTGQFHDAGFSFGQGFPYTVALGDINGDEIVDVVTTGWKNNSGDPCPNRIGINDGSGKFTETGQLIELGMAHSHGLALGDLDKDGDLDLVISMQQSPYCLIYFNDGKGTFTAGPKIGSKDVEKVCLGDLDGDGDLDIFLACLTTNEVWLNTGSGQFENSGLKLGASVWSWSAALGDLNNDGRLDVFVANIAFDDPYVPRGRVAEVWLNNTFICDYFGQIPPGIVPLVFAPDVISKNNLNEHSPIAISPKGDEIYWSSVTTTDYKEQIYYTKKENGIWTKPALADFINTKYGATAPSFTPDGKKIFFSYNTEGQGNIMYVVRTEDGWSDPIEVEDEYNSDFIKKNTTVFTNKGNAYCIAWDSSFSNNRRALRYKYSEGKFSEPTTVIIHPDFHPWGSIYVSPDEDYLIFDGYKCTQNCSDDTYFSSVKLYICFKDASGNWGYPISTGLSERFPVVSPDGKYLFFAKTRGSTYDFYWVSSSIIDDLKQIALSASVTEKESIQYKIFPNPTSQTIQIKGIDMQLNDANFKLIDLNGKTIKQGKLVSEKIDISELPKGIYMLSLNTNDGRITEKIVIE